MRMTPSALLARLLSLCRRKFDPCLACALFTLAFQYLGSWDIVSQVHFGHVVHSRTPIECLMFHAGSGPQLNSKILPLFVA
jgi:hypothetical protein